MGDDSESLAWLGPAVEQAKLGTWTAQGVCTETDPEVFFPVPGDAGLAAKRICGGCPVRRPCLA
jgi:hypothetical protein